MDVSLLKHTTNNNWILPEYKSIRTESNEMAPNVKDNTQKSPYITIQIPNYNTESTMIQSDEIEPEKNTSRCSEENKNLEKKPDSYIMATSSLCCDSRSLSTDSLAKHMTKSHHQQMMKSITDIYRADDTCSNITQRSCSFLRRCNSANSVASDALYQMINQLDKKGITLPTKDYKILELMVVRHQKSLDELEEQKISLDHWNKQLEIEKQRKDEDILRRKEHLMNKHETEMQLREMKRVNALTREKAEIQLKQEIFREKAERWKMQYEKQEQFKKDVIQRMKLKELNQKEAQKEMVETQLKNKNREKDVLALDSDYRLVYSMQSRQYKELQTILKLKSDNAESREKHQQQIKIIEETFRENLNILKEEIQLKDEQIARNRLTQKQIKEAKRKKEIEEREIRSSRVKDEMERQKSEWQQEMSKMEMEQHVQAEQRAQNILTERKYSVRRERIQKMTRHRRKMNSIENEEKRRVMKATESIRLKEEKCHQLAMQQEEKIQQSKDVARESSNLRHRLKHILEQEILGKRLTISDMQPFNMLKQI